VGSGSLAVSKRGWLAVQATTFSRDGSQYIIGLADWDWIGIEIGNGIRVGVGAGLGLGLGSGL
jgi:hypothetical protein